AEIVVHMMRVRKYMIWAAVMTFLVGCSLPGSKLPDIGDASLKTPNSGSLSAVPSITPEPTIQPVAVTMSPTIPASATHTQASTEVVPTPEVENPTIQICSPLTIHPLEELQEIISDPYRPPPPGKEQRHHGVDFSYYRHGDRLTIQGVGVQTVLPGQVSAALTDTFPYGNLVIIETSYVDLPREWAEALQIQPGDSIYTLYAHMEQAPQVIQGEKVGACSLLGEVGVSGNAVEPHLHLEMRLGAPGASFNSMGFYKADDTDEERSNYLRWRTSGEFQHFDPMLVLSGSMGAAGAGE
ncbi:MAG: peptidoglycan DD-metalloendopeptidase family protein, partial [Anaerolineales bacterium]